ncbi:MAG TPA: ABC transporter permease [Candidatus Angelobacter sp.]
MQTFLQDLRYSLRQMRKNPGFAIVAVLVLALGIAVSTAMFTVLNGVLLRKPGFAEIDRLVTIAEPRGGNEHFWGVSLADVKDWRAQSHLLEQIAYYQLDQARWERDTGTQQLDVLPVSGNFFATLGVQPILGRTFVDQDEQNRARIVVLNHQLWQDSFASNPKVLGQTMKLNGEFYEIVGVMPVGFAYPLGEMGAIWKPRPATPDDEKHGDESLTVFGRLKSGVKLENAEAELSAIQARLAQTYPSDKLVDRVRMRHYWDTIVGRVRPALLALASAVVLIWLVACANVASLMLTRNSVRQREMAIRRALGADKLRLVRQLLTENLLYSVVATGVGLLLAYGAVRVLEHKLVHALSLPGNMSLRIDSTVLLSLIGLSILSTLAFGLLPALQASGAAVQHGLQARVGETTRKQGRLRDALVIGEIAVSLLLLTGAGLLLRSLYLLHQVPLGFSTENIITSGFSIPHGRYANESVNLALYQPLIERIEQIPGVQSAAITSVMPLKKGFEMVGMFGIVGQKGVSPDKLPQGDLRYSSPEYPQTLGITVERGRFFDPKIDTPDSQPVVVVNHTFAARYLQGEDPTQKALRMGAHDPWKSVPIVGVVADVRQTAVNLPPGPEIHLCTSQLAPGSHFYQIGSAFAQIAVRTRQNPTSVIAAVRKAAHDVAPDVATGEFSTMSQVLEDSLGNQTLAARLVTLFAGATLLIAIAGLYGLLNYSVGQRVHEIGVRMALGAQKEDVVRMVLRRAFLLLTLGLCAGVTLAFFTSRVLHSFLYGIHEHDIATTAAVSLLLCLCGMIAAYLPARRAASVDPLQALRAE